MKKGVKTVLVFAVVALAAGAGVFAFRGRLFPPRAAQAGTPAYATVKVTRGSIVSSVSASGQLEPSSYVTIRPDSNMPTRKLVRIFVKPGQHVKAGQPLAEIDPTGLDLSWKSAEANYKAQEATLGNLKSKPANLDTAASEAALLEASATLESQKETYDNAKALADKELASKSTLADAERQLATARASYTSALLSYQNVKAQSAAADIQAQESTAATADYNRQIAKIILDSTMIRSPMTGTVAEVLVDVGDLVSTSTAIAYVVDTRSMLLTASVNENDMPLLKVGQKAVVTQSAYSDLTFSGVVKLIDLHASTSSNVSTFTTTIEVPNPAGKLLWGMNADAEISVVSLTNVLTLPSSAVKTSNGSSTVTILDQGKPVTWDVRIGATDGSKVQILAGLDEGQEVVTTKKATATAAVVKQNQQMQEGGMGGPPDSGMGGGVGGIMGGMMR